MLFLAGADSCFERAEVVASVSTRWGLHPSYMHSFCMTAGYFVLVEQPLAVSTVQVCKTLLQRQPLVAALRWFDEPVSWSGRRHSDEYAWVRAYLPVIQTEA